MNNVLKIFIGILFIGLIAFGISTFYKDNSPTSYVTIEENETIKNEIKPIEIITGSAVIDVPVIISFANKKEHNLGYLPRILVLKDLVNGGSVKLNKTEIMVAQIRGDTSVLLAIIGENTNNIGLTEGYKGNYNTLDGEINLLYENKEIRIEKLT